MKAEDLYRPIPTVTVQQVKDLLRDMETGEYNLIDVRQPAEFSQGHIPGARLIPLGELAARAAEIDRSKPTVLYCRSGNRSSAAAGLLLDAGVRDAASMDGGMLAWNGLVAGGPPEAGMAYFSGKEKSEDLIALAWSLEEGSRRFYARAAETLESSGGAGFFADLVSAEEHHKDVLLKLFRELSGDAAAASLPAALFSGIEPGSVMEGGMSVAKAAAWIEGKAAVDVLDLSLALESHAYDLYLKMERTMASENAKQVFRVLASEEKAHLERMVALLEQQDLSKTP